ncbi:MAG: class I SAM-dependent methyltransferase [bacterium]|nr:class I SAM-dependent methyltransferase [bacterium]
MTLRPPAHIEAQDPKFRLLSQQTQRAWLVWALLSLVGFVVLGGVALVMSIIALGSLLISLILNVYHRLQIENFQHYKQTEALLSLHAHIRPRQPLPPMRLWAASPDFATLLLTHIQQQRPGMVVELGSGVSTLITGYALQALRQGSMISVDHDANFAAVSRSRVQQHSLSDCVQVIHAPLISLSVQGQTWQWYDLSELNNAERIDLLIVDGPPEQPGTLSRYPALPLLFERLKPDALIVVDDFMRDDEQAMVGRWLAEFKLEVVEVVDNEKGAVVLRKLS